MAIVIRNGKPRGRFFRYRVDGAPKSVWIDGYSEVVIKELNDSSTMLDKVSRAKAERLNKLSNTKSLSRDLIESRTSIFKNVSQTDKWRPKLLNLETGYNTYLFSKEGRKFLFASPPEQHLVIGADIKGSNLNALSAYYNGVYTYGAFDYTINNSEITSITSNTGSGTTALTFNCYSVTHTATTQAYQAYTSGSTNIYDNGAQWFSSTGGTGVFWTGVTGGFHYSGDSVYIINVIGSQVSASRVFEEQQSGPIFSAYTLYQENANASYDKFIAAASGPYEIGTVYYSNNTLQTVWNITGTYKYDVPASDTNKRITLTVGEVTSVANYTASPPIVVNQSGSTATTETVYIDSTETIDEIGISWMSTNQLISKANITGVYIDFNQDPNRYMEVAGGRVLTAGDVTVRGGSYDSWSVIDSGQNILTIYTTQGESITTVSTTVYAQSDGTGSVTKGVYTYNDSGTNKNITIDKFSAVENVVNAGR